MIKHFRFIRSFFFALSIFLFYFSMAVLNRFMPESLFNKLLHRSNLFIAKRVRINIFRLRGIFIKLGQFMGVMSNLFYPEIAKELEALQDRVPPVSYDKIKKRFIHEFGVEPEEFFREFEKEPLASASLGQVHIAYTKDGRKVCVKVLYPGMEELVKKDLKSIKAILNLANLFFPFFDPAMIYDEFAETVKAEIDYNKELRNIKEISQNFADDPDILFPNVIEEVSSGAIITTEFIDGIKINQIDEMAAEGINTEEVAELLVRAYCKMIFIDRKFHADPHPGNLFVLKTHPVKIVFIDFGSVEIFSERFNQYAPSLIKAVVNKRIPAIVDNLEHMGFMTRMANREEIEALIAMRYEKYENLKIEDYSKLDIKEFNDFDAIKKLDLNLGELMRSFQVPRKYMFLWRTIALLAGLSANLSPKVNVFEIAWPYVEESILGKDKNLSDFIASDIKNLAMDVMSLPEYGLKTLELINQGKVKVQIKDYNKGIKILYHLGHQFIYTFLLITSGTFSLVLYMNNLSYYGEIFKYIAIAFSVLLGLSFCRYRKIKDY